jgi:hypothetical protein
VGEVNQDLVAAAEGIQSERYPESKVIFLAGSLVRGEGTETSDLDLVVVHEKLPRAFRESFHFRHWPVEAFVHDPETLKYFIYQRDKPTGIPVLMSMIVEGIEIPESTSFSQAMKRLAEAALAEGPQLWSPEETERSRYMITGLVDDLRDPRSNSECAASGGALYDALANHYFRSRALWSAKNKMIPRKLQEADADLAAQFDSSFAALFESGNPTEAIELAERIIAPDGGWLFEGYTSYAPKEWRTAFER